MTIAWEGYRLGGRYELQELLGEGGMSAVYKAFDHNLKRTVAVKIIHPHLANDPDFVRRFETEARAVAQLRHPNIVQVFDFAHEGELYYMVLEYIPGESLQKVLQRLRERGERLPWAEALRLMVPLADAVDYAHRQGMIHRDIKPANILLTPQGDPILTDFGLARMMGGTHHTRTGMVLGTVLYMAPEQVRGEHVDPRADIYALGAVLFELLTGQPPFHGQNLAEIMQQHLEAPVPDPKAWVPDLPPELTVVVQRALAKAPEERYPTAGEFKTALERILSAEASSPSPSHTLVESLAPALGGTLVEPQEAISAPKDGLTPKAGATMQEPGVLAAPGEESAASGTSAAPSSAASSSPRVASLVQEATKTREGALLTALAALEAALLAGAMAGLAYLVERVEVLWLALAWWGGAVVMLVRLLPAWWRLSSKFRLALVPAEAAAEDSRPPLGPGLPSRFRVPRLDFPQDLELMILPAALSAVLTTGLGLAAVLGLGWIPLMALWLAVVLLLGLFHLRFLALNFLQPGVLDRIHFGHFLLSLSFGLIALPGMAGAAYLPAGLREGVLVVALGAFGVGGMLGSLTLIFLLRRTLNTGLPRPVLAPLAFFLGPLVAVYTFFALILLDFLRIYGMAIPQVLSLLVVLMAWGIVLAGEGLAAMVYQGYRQTGIPTGPLRWGLVEALTGPALLAVATWAVGLRYPPVVALGVVSVALGALVFLWVAWEVARQR